MLQKCHIFAVAAVFFHEPTKDHYLMEIARKAGIAHTSVKRFLAEFKKMGIIDRFGEKKGKRFFPAFRARINSIEYRRVKRIYNLFVLEKSGLIDLLQDRFMPKAVVLFGSFAWGEDIEDSDIDLFVASKERPIDLARFKIALHRKIQLHFKQSVKDYPPELRNNIINGIVLRGYMEAF